MRVLVTGHLGYIGTVLTPLLMEQGHEVIGLDSDLYDGCTFEGALPDVPTIRKDIRNVELKDLKGVQAVLHLAALSNDPLGNLNPELTFEINHKASVRLAEMAKEAGVERFIFSSSCSTYGAGGEGMLDETASFNPVTPYGQSKIFVERDVSPMAGDRFSPIFLRNATAYGVSPRLRFDIVLNNLTAWAFSTGKVLIKSDGTPWRPLVHIRDISMAFIAALRTPRERIHNQAFNIGQSSANHQVRQIAEVVAQTVPDCRIEFAAGASSDKRDYRVNCDKAKRTLDGFDPQWNIQRGAKELYETYRRVGLKLEDFEGPRFQRIAHIKKCLAEGSLDGNLRSTH